MSQNQETLSAEQFKAQQEEVKRNKVIAEYTDTKALQAHRTRLIKRQGVLDKISMEAKTPAETAEADAIREVIGTAEQRDKKMELTKVQSIKGFVSSPEFEAQMSALTDVNLPTEKDYPLMLSYFYDRVKTESAQFDNFPNPEQLQKTYIKNLEQIVESWIRKQELAARKEEEEKALADFDAKVREAGIVIPKGYEAKLVKVRNVGVQSSLDFENGKKATNGTGKVHVRVYDKEGKTICIGKTAKDCCVELIKTYKVDKVIMPSWNPNLNGAVVIYKIAGQNGLFVDEEYTLPIAGEAATQ